MKKYFEIIFVAIALFVFFFPMFVGMGVLDGDLGDEYMPKLFFLGESLREYRIPTIADAIGLGFPIYKDIQSAIYYPINWLFAFPSDFIFKVQAVIIINLLLYIIGLYLLLRYMMKDRNTRILLLILLSFNGFIISHIPHYTMLSSIAMIPYYILFFLKFLNERRRRYFYLSVLFLALSVTGGHPQIPFFAVIISVMLFINKSRNFKVNIQPLMIPIFAVFVTLFILLPMLQISRYAVRTGGTLQINLLPIKYLILLIFPNLFGGASIIGDSTYNGILNINEVLFYPSLIFYFIFVNYCRRVVVDKNIFMLKKMIMPAVFILLAYFPAISFNIFVTPIRALGISIMLFICLNISDFIKTYKLLDLKIAAVPIIFMALLACFRGIDLSNIILPLLLFVIYALIFLSKDKFKQNHWVLILTGIALIDLGLSNFNILQFAKYDEIRNEKYDITKGSYVITYLPDDALFYSDYIKKYHNVDNLELLKKYSTFANRGIYYGCRSFNIYENFIFKEYVEYFNDYSMMNGGFSNLSFIVNPLVVRFDYVFIPDIPAIFAVNNVFVLPFNEDYKDTFIIFYTDSIEDVQRKSEFKDEFFRNMPEIKSGIIIVDGQFIFKGNGKVFMMKKYSSNSIIHFPYLFDKIGLQRIKNGPFVLFKSKETGSSYFSKFYSRPIDGKIIEGSNTDYIPIDLFGGLFISIIALLTMIYYVKKEIE